MIQRIEESIPAALGGQRIDRVVSLLADVSRNEAAALLTAGKVLIDSQSPAKPSERVNEGQVVLIEVERTVEVLEPDSSVQVPVIHEDEHVLVVNKPAGLIVHPGAGAIEGTMAHGLLARYPELASVGHASRPGIVHRLDKGTSGLLMVARTEQSLRSLSAQLADRSVLRRYQVLVWGRVDSAEGLIDAPIGRSERDRTRHAVVAGGREARTRYEVSERFDAPELSALICRLETGRTHQIRVHLEAISHPVVGDDRYGATEDRLGLKRPFLHAGELGFVHPVSQQRLTFSADTPADLVAVIERLRSTARSE